MPDSPTPQYNNDLIQRIDSVTSMWWASLPARQFTGSVCVRRFNSWPAFHPVLIVILLLVACCSGKDAETSQYPAKRDSDSRPFDQSVSALLLPFEARLALSPTTEGVKGLGTSCVFGGDARGVGCGGGSTLSYGPPSAFIAAGGGFKGARRNHLYQLSSTRDISAFKERKFEVTIFSRESKKDDRQSAPMWTDPDRKGIPSRVESDS